MKASISSTSETLSNRRLGCLSKLFLVTGLSLGAALIGWFAGKAWIKHVAQQGSEPVLANQVRSLAVSKSQAFSSSPGTSEAELQRKTALRTRLLNLGISQPFFSALSDRVFFSQYPALAERSLTDSPEDAQWRAKKDEIAATLLDKLSRLSLEARQGLGSYTQAQRDRWKLEVNQLHLSSRSLYNLANAAFFEDFPEQENQSFLDTPFGQVWSAIVFDTLKALQSGQGYEQIIEAADQRAIAAQGTLKPGQGKAYVMRLSAAETLNIQLDSDGDTRLSLYSPTGQNNLLDNARTRQWSGQLPENGFYELLVISRAQSPLNYQLTLTSP
jgi:serine/threonine-protein kinase